MRLPVRPFPSVGTVAAPFGSPAGPRLHRYHELVDRSLPLPATSGLPRQQVLLVEGLFASRGRPHVPWNLVAFELGGAAPGLRGEFLLKRRSRRDRMKAKLKEIGGELRRRMQQPIRQQAARLKQVVTGYFRYHAVPTNRAALAAFRDEVCRRWRWSHGRRGEKGDLTWARMKKLADDWLPQSWILHPCWRRKIESNESLSAVLRQLIRSPCKSRLASNAGPDYSATRLRRSSRSPSRLPSALGWNVMPCSILSNFGY